MYQFGTSQQDVRKIFEKIKGQAEAAVQATLEKSIDALIKNIKQYWLGPGALDFLGVTGNAFSSVTAGLYHKNKLVYANWNGKHVKKPTMKSLAEGQMYPLPEYYDGDSAVHRRYKGEYGAGGQWGPQIGPWVIYSQRYMKNLAGNDWTVLVAIPVSYAGANEKIAKALQNMMNALPSLVDYNVVRVENAPVQTDAFKDSPPF